MELTQENVEVLIVVLAAVFSIAATFLVTYVRKLMLSVGELVGVKTTEENVRAGQQAVKAGFAYAEEQMQKYLRGLVPHGPRTGKEKLEVAKTAARSIAPEALSKVGDVQLEILIEAEVQERKQQVAALSLAPPPMVELTSDGTTLMRRSVNPLAPARLPNDVFGQTTPDRESPTAPESPRSKGRP